jgi:AraC family transcriptional regulator of adaptative response/methylated-DNA-[protein]-cysteine methyltransferase
MRPTDAQYETIVTCTAAGDGRFWYGVATTRIYCRPSCRSRAPHRDNIRIFDAPAAAEAAGFRPCKRCSPHNAESPAHETAQALEEAAAFLRQRAGADVRWQEAAESIHLSPAHFHRLFRSRFGIAPGAFLNRCRLERVQATSAGAATVLARAYEAGFGSPAAYYRARSRYRAIIPGE